MDMETTNHLENCSLLAYERWAARWTGACDRCGGEGAITFPGTRWDPPSSDACGNCAEKGLCPRGCGETLIYTENDACDYAECIYCGWSEYLLLFRYRYAYGSETSGFALDMTFGTPECICDMERHWAEEEHSDNP